MGEYYDWVNVDKKQYISPFDFNLGLKRTESCWENNELLRALFDLLSTDWKGDHIVFLGDYSEATEDEENETLKIIYNDTLSTECPGILYDAVIGDSYKDIAGLYKASEEVVREEIEIYLEWVGKPGEESLNYYDTDVDNPYNGLFIRDGQDFLNMINHTKKVYYSLETTKFFHDNKELHDFNPLPILMAYGEGFKDGEWVGGIVGV
jgi:hypothetical protein